ncbi:hypothetical protein [Mucilaginibacter sp. OK098]|uniref:hypothetical protein n=1 Tax=Mucilaginibacter sp. OK098 TaxID=1855297 RepID=UPI0009129B6C|nr:hypothetical protein [Mucilaginibacter sp. OK098]SHM13429.1 hypothetical protein SAMN05216524_101921 [Mucilaginibacter sp. OK098]
MQTTKLNNIDEITHIGNHIWESWASMWNGDLSITKNIIAEGLKVHLTAAARYDPNNIVDGSGVKEMVSSIRNKYRYLKYKTLAGPFVDVQQQVVTAHWEAQIVFDGRSELPNDIAGETFTIVGTDILKFKDNKIYEFWTMNNPARP